MKLAFACLLILVAACWLADRASEPPAGMPAPRAAAMRSPQSGSVPPAAGRQWMDAVGAARPATPAWESLADARQHGDARMPPLAAPAPRDAGPSPAQLADPAAYQRYEQDQNARVMANYAAAVDAEVPRLRADVERARAMGIPAAEIAKVEAKIFRLEKLKKSIAETGGVND
ncbi:hypothetical protein [Massilia sp. CF038]|uniref:hypothetical protein n=1 Tax=Massilia sp. CF038 TaxID=1881045 RepID=UPI0009191805|nr:hypothetical protein [Massilia sp. CF038]SHH63245.1 hypothetical protein SAMN05428948_4727 [Massilia sp. CF038]